jgi:hypothetical protein
MRELIMSRWNKAVVAVLLLLTLAGFSFLSTYRVWDGGFPQAEYRLTFIDPAGKPIKGVVLAVTDHHGNPAYYYPVSDYSDASAPTSGGDGLISFRHVGGGMEFGGACWRLFFLIPIGRCNPPEYECVFSRGNEVIYRCHYAAFSSGEDWQNLPVRREAWAPPRNAPEKVRRQEGMHDFRVVRRTIQVEGDG